MCSHNDLKYQLTNCKVTSNPGSIPFRRRECPLWSVKGEGRLVHISRQSNYSLQHGQQCQIQIFCYGGVCWIHKVILFHKHKKYIYEFLFTTKLTLLNAEGFFNSTQGIDIHWWLVIICTLRERKLNKVWLAKHTYRSRLWCIVTSCNPFEFSVKIRSLLWRNANLPTPLSKRRCTTIFWESFLQRLNWKEITGPFLSFREWRRERPLFHVRFLDLGKALFYVYSNDKQLGKVLVEEVA